MNSFVSKQNWWWPVWPGGRCSCFHHGRRGEPGGLRCLWTNSDRHLRARPLL